ncbi:pyruvate dehydrogenase (acetyl-transferring) E1 component subunit alpha [Oceanobacillus sp. Castelsardo]|uniref:pyruvate dehydrogenase (acetyl-transferring) E1 component subunit alpha n=1 Tax=Oceanobacillus sp. Castelsardo TaxID=1851204 RepID=UPI00083858A7|nr:pyruvate dehydrogenase (acetyl-transferring) E1 component subunit alpha [Oceanobacillus sp. Castelsardo]
MFREEDLTFERVERLNEDGVLLHDKKVVSDEQVLEMYQWMLKARLLDEKLLRMQRQGRIGTYAPYSGQEAAQIGSVFALEKSDWICPSYREHAGNMVHGMPLEQIILYAKGHLHGGRVPEDVNILPVQIIIAAQTLHAVGTAYAQKYRGEKHVSVSYFGDGATSQGDFHEALNFASVYQVPAIFFCQNNQYAISVPVEKQMASKSIAQKAVAYGMPGVQVDGNDVLAVYEVMKEAVERARNGEGPTLIEAVTYRLGPHTTSDDPTKYRSKENVEPWREVKDPLRRVRLYLENSNLWDVEKEKAFVQTFQDELDHMIDEIESKEKEFPKVEEAFEYVYQEKNAQLEEQQAEARRIREEGDWHE